MNKFLGTRIQNAREHKGLSQKEAAELVNVSKSAWSLYESENRRPDITTLTVIAKKLEVSIDYLVGLTDEMEIKK